MISCEGKHILEIPKKLAELTEQECIGFAEWVDGNFSMDNDKIWYSINLANIESHYGLTSKELFQLYLKTKGI